MRMYVVSKCAVEFNPKNYNTVEDAVYAEIDPRDFLAVFDNKKDAMEFASKQRVVTYKHSYKLATAYAVIVETYDNCEPDEDYPEYGGYDIFNADFIEMDVFAEEFEVEEEEEEDDDEE